jgi:hypothetical protein
VLTKPPPPTTHRNRPVDPVKAALEKARPPAWMAKYGEQDAGKGISWEWEDCAYWLSLLDDDVIDWIEAIREVDQTGDKGQLLALLRSQRLLLPRAQFHLADLLKRYNLASLIEQNGLLLPRDRARVADLIDGNGLKKKKPNRPARPSYEVDEKTLRLKFAVEEVRRREGIYREQRIAVVAALMTKIIDKRQIATALRGSDHSLVRLNKRLDARR